MQMWWIVYFMTHLCSFVDGADLNRNRTSRKCQGLFSLCVACLFRCFSDKIFEINFPSCWKRPFCWRQRVWPSEVRVTRSLHCSSVVGCRAAHCWFFRRPLVFHGNLVTGVPHSKCQSCHSAARRQNLPFPISWVTWSAASATQVTQNVWSHRIHSMSSHWQNSGFAYRSSGPTAVTNISQRGVLLLEISEKCDG